MKTALLLLAALGVTACSGSDGGGEPQVRVSQIVIIPGTISFNAVGDTRRLSTNVRDQDGIAINGAQVAWTSSDPSVVSVDANGVVTSVGNGSATVVARFEGVEASIPATVEQEVEDARIVDGNGQIGVVGTELEVPLVLQIRDPLQAGIRGLPVTFAIDEAAGTLSAAEATTDAEGQVQVRWTLGAVAGQGLTVQALLEGTPIATFEAQALPGPASQLVVEGGADQVGLTLQRLGRPVELRVLDGFGNPVREPISLTVAQGGGLLDRTEITPDETGRGSFTWTLGGTAGAQAVDAVTGQASTTIEATAVAAVGPPSAVVRVGSLPLAAPALSALGEIEVQVVDAQGAGVVGVPVSFTTSDGEASPTQGTTDASGVAGTQWTLGPAVGTQRLTVTAQGIAPLVIEAQASEPLPSCDPGPVDSSRYDLELCYLTEVSPEVRAAFEAAKARWEQIIVGDLSDIEENLEGFECANNGLPIRGLVDDVIIYVTVEEIDGPFNVLGSAGPCRIRQSNALTVVGRMRFDVADMDRMVALNQLEDVILHEMGHVLGIGTLWNTLGLLQNPSNGNEPLPDTHFTGAEARAAFDAAGGDVRTAGQKVPVENSGGAGTRNGHWRESTMNRELMTGFLDAGPRNPLSAITIGSLTDIGYTVDPTVADAYDVFAPNSAPGAEAPERLHLVDDILWLPLSVVDERGRVVRVIQPPRF